MSAAPIPQEIERLTAGVRSGDATMEPDWAGAYVRYADHAAALAASEARALEAEAWKRDHQAFLLRLSVALVIDGNCKQDTIEQCVDELAAKHRAAEQSLAEARKDAERYRAYRASTVRPVLFGDDGWSEADTDAAIDTLLPKGEGATS